MIGYSRGIDHSFGDCQTWVNLPSYWGRWGETNRRHYKHGNTNPICKGCKSNEKVEARAGQRMSERSFGTSQPVFTLNVVSSHSFLMSLYIWYKIISDEWHSLAVSPRPLNSLKIYDQILEVFTLAVHLSYLWAIHVIQMPGIHLQTFCVWRSGLGSKHLI